MNQIEGGKTSNRYASTQSFPTPSNNHSQTDAQWKEQEQNQFAQGKTKQIQSFPKGKQDYKTYGCNA